MLNRLSSTHWNYATAAHLLNRAGFGGTPTDIDKLVHLGLEGAVSELVDFEKIPDPVSAPDWAKPDPDRATKFRQMSNASPEERREMVRAEQRLQRERTTSLRQWWLNRMIHGPRPLQEKLTLFWHGHFATSVQKVRDAYLMWLQNQTFRTYALGPWLELLTKVAKDPAMLIWLDQAQSRKEHPNENFAREVMELFTLGEGHYTERDVTEAARALTGWSFDRVRQEFAYRPRLHDGGEKTVLGITGPLSGEDVLRQIESQPQAARYICGKLWSFFANENPPDDLVNALAERFRAGGSSFKPVLRAMFSSEEFYSDSVVRHQVKSPVQWLVSTVRALECDLPPAMITTQALRLLGQDLFAPPNVKGWDGGLSWITTNNLLNRYNFAALLVLGEAPFAPGAMMGANAPAPARRMAAAGNRRVGRPLDVSKILSPEERQDKVKLLAALERRLVHGKLREKQAKALREYLESQGALDDEDVRQTIRLLMSTPDFQVT